MCKFYIIISLVFAGISSKAFAQQQDTVVQDTVYYNADSIVLFPQYHIAYWINDSVFVNTSDSVAILDSVINTGGDSTILNVDTDSNAVPANGRNFTQIFDSLTSGLIPNRIPYGVLYDQSPEWTNLCNPADTISDKYFLYQSWLDMENSRIAPQDSGMYSQMRQAVNREIGQGRYPLLTIHNNFAYIDSEAILDGRLSLINGILTDNGGESPYNVAQANMSGFPVNSLMQNDSVTFEFMA